MGEAFFSFFLSFFVCGCAGAHLRFWRPQKVTASRLEGGDGGNDVAGVEGNVLHASAAVKLHLFVVFF
jgi:hypothetical protein